MTVNYKLIGVPYLLAASAVAAPTTGDTNENTLATITIPAGAIGANGIVRVHTQWSYTNSANTKTLRVRLGGIGGTAYLSLSVTTTATLRDLRTIHNRNSESSQVGGASNTSTPIGTTSGAVITSAVNTAASTTLVITGQNGLGSETITLESYLVEVIYKA